MSPRKAVRCKKARWPGTCGLCRGPIRLGQQIASAKGAPWAHIWCVIECTTTQPPGRTTS